MRVVRTQWPVGQGCFATGIIDAEGHSPFHYVYDCGARNVTELEPKVERYADLVEKVDALFISHFDGDHVDGLDMLLARAHVVEVYLPYLDMAHRILAVIEEMIAGRLRSTFIQAQLDPVRWLTERGADRIIFVRNGGGPEPYTPPETVPERADPDAPLTPKTQASEASSPEDGFTSETDGFATGASSIRPMEMNVGGAVHLVKGHQVAWILVPYVPAVDEMRIKSFRKRITDVLELPQDSAIPADVVIEKLKTDEGREALRECYDEIIKGGASTAQHNKISMSLYSGPVAADEFYVTQVQHRIDPVWWHFNERGNGTAWIGAGDAKLKDGATRLAWTLFYSKVLPLVGTFLLPHHGSKANWHPTLLTSVPANFFLAAADGRDEGYRHPSPKVVDQIEHSGGFLVHVTKKMRSRFIEILRSNL